MRFAFILALLISAPGATAIAEDASSVSLGFTQAIDMALKQNLQTLLATEHISESKGHAKELASELWPQITATASQQNMTENLTALGFEGFSLPGIPTVIGPYGIFDARVRLVDTLLDMRRFMDLETGRAQLRLAELEEGLSKLTVESQAALDYLEASRSGDAVTAAHADLDLAKSLLKLAQDEHQAGVAQGVDVARAQTRVAEETYHLAQAKFEAERAMLNLKRVTGIALGTDVTLSDSVRFDSQTVNEAAPLIAEALNQRIELNVAREQVHVEELEAKAALGEHLPSISIEGDYGLSGTNPEKNDYTTRAVGAFASLPLFNGGISGRIEEADSRKRQAQLMLADLEQQIEEEVRLSLTEVGTAAEQVTAAAEALTLAQKELAMAKDRFSSGAADNLEVLSAQTALASARENHVTALALYNGARVRLALALGRMENFKL